jgi:hypothetical protein
MKKFGLAVAVMVVGFFTVGAVSSIQSGGSSFATLTVSGTITAAAATFSGLVTMAKGFMATGANTANAVGAQISYDNMGIRQGFMATDAAPSVTVFRGRGASPLGSTNKTGGNVYIVGGDTTHSSTAVVANCGASDTWTLVTTSFADGVGTGALTSTTKTCTRDAATDSSTLFTCGASNAALAQNAMTCLITATGVSGCAGTSCTVAANGFDGVAGNFYLYIASSESPILGMTLASSGNHGVVTTVGNGGAVVFAAPITGLPTAAMGANGLILPTAKLIAFSSTTSLNSGDTGISSLDGGIIAIGNSGDNDFSGGVKLTSLVLIQADVGATCTTGNISYDTGGVTDELCYCQATNTWMCTAVTAGPLD